MNPKKPIGLWLGGIALAGMLLAPAANAGLQNITSPNLPSYVSVVGNYPIAVAPSEVSDFTWLVDQVHLYNQNNGTKFKDPEPPAVLDGHNLTKIDVEAWEGHYLFVHWDNGAAQQLFKKDEKPDGFNQAFFITEGDNSALSLTRPVLTSGSKEKSVGGAHWYVYDPPPPGVPDSGSTLGLLASAIAFIGGVRFKLAK